MRRITVQLGASRPDPPEMPRAKEGDEQRAQANEPPFDDHIRPFGRKSEQEDEANREVKEPPQDIDDRRGFADALVGRRTGSGTSGR